MPYRATLSHPALPNVKSISIRDVRAPGRIEWVAMSQGTVKERGRQGKTSAAT
jgi:hypothetical protein